MKSRDELLDELHEEVSYMDDARLAALIEFERLGRLGRAAIAQSAEKDGPK